MLSLTAMRVNTPCQLCRRKISLTESKHNDKQRMPWRVVTGAFVIQYNALWLRAVSLICLRSARLRVRARSHPRTSALALEIYNYNKLPIITIYKSLYLMVLRKLNTKNESYCSRQTPSYLYSVLGKSLWCIYQLSS